MKILMFEILFFPLFSIFLWNFVRSLVLAFGFHLTLKNQLFLLKILTLELILNFNRSCYKIFDVVGSQISRILTFVNSYLHSLRVLMKQTIDRI